MREIKPKPDWLLWTIIFYFGFVSFPQLISMGQQLQASPQWLLQRRPWPEAVIAQDLGAAYTALYRAAHSTTGTICLSPEVYNQTIASRSGFAAYFVQKRLVTINCQERQP